MVRVSSSAPMVRRSARDAVIEHDADYGQQHDRRERQWRARLRGQDRVDCISQDRRMDNRYRERDAYRNRQCEAR